MSPGISVRPLPRIRCTGVPAGSAIGVLEIVLMTLPVTNTCEGPNSRSVLPSKIRTFSNTTAEDVGPCANATAASATAMTTATLIRILRAACINTPRRKGGRTRSRPGRDIACPDGHPRLMRCGPAILRLGYAGAVVSMRKAGREDPGDTVEPWCGRTRLNVKDSGCPASESSGPRVSFVHGRLTAHQLPLFVSESSTLRTIATHIAHARVAK